MASLKGDVEVPPYRNRAKPLASDDRDRLGSNLARRVGAARLDVGGAKPGVAALVQLTDSRRYVGIVFLASRQQGLQLRKNIDERTKSYPRMTGMERAKADTKIVKPIST